MLCDLLGFDLRKYEKYMASLPTGTKDEDVECTPGEGQNGLLLNSDSERRETPSTPYADACLVTDKAWRKRSHIDCQCYMTQEEYSREVS